MRVDATVGHLGFSPGENPDWTLDAPEARVLALLRVRRGRSQAISARDLASLAGLEGSCVRRASPRGIQTIIARLREQHGCPILSSAGRPPGYWWAATAEELEQCIREQRRKAISTLIVLRALRRHRARLAGQQEMSEGSTLNLEPRTSNAGAP